MTISNKLVSVIMSVHNAEQTLEQSILSIIDQTYTNIEFLIVDDFSDDKSIKILKSYSTKFNNIKVFYNTENIGLTKSLNKLIALSKGDYIARQDADDVSMKNRIECQVNIMEKYNLDFSSTRAVIKDSNKKIPGLSFYLNSKLISKFKNPFIHGTFMFKKKSLEELGLYDENFYYSQDYKLINEMFKNKFRYKKLYRVYYELNMLNNISSIKKIEQKYYSDCVKNNINPTNI